MQEKVLPSLLLAGAEPPPPSEHAGVYQEENLPGNPVWVPRGAACSGGTRTGLQNNQHPGT